MSLRTKEKLEAMFNQSKLRQKKLKEQKKKQSQQRLKEIYRHQDILLKKSFREEKKKVMDNLYALVNKRSENDRKPPSYEFKIYRTQFIERDTAEDDLYTTFNELMEAQERGEGRINIEKWKQIVEETKAMLNQSI